VKTLQISLNGESDSYVAQFEMNLRPIGNFQKPDVHVRNQF